MMGGGFVRRGTMGKLQARPKPRGGTLAAGFGLGTAVCLEKHVHELECLGYYELRVATKFL